ANTDMMLFGAEELVSFMSERFTLREGDVIAFGSPANPGRLERGDSVEITYGGVGTLRNSVV
ncbi:MAG: fumarylacetoacetate hydrolase family protein, partial [Halobacteriales archaeon]